MNALTVEMQEIEKRASLESLLERFLQDQDIAKSSKATYRRALKQFILWLQDTNRMERMDTLQRLDILAYKEHLLSCDKSPYTVSCYMTTVRKLYEWLEAEKLYPNIAKGVKGAKKPKGHRKDCLTVDQIRTALDAIDRTTTGGLRDFALFNLMVRTGLRDIEVSRARVGDIRQESGQAVLWIQGKGRDSKDDFVLLLEPTLKPLRHYLSATGTVTEEAPLFCSQSDRNRGRALTTKSISRIIKESLRRIRLDDSRLTAHSLRHSAISLSIQGGASLEQAQAMARHSDPGTTMAYFHNLNRIEAGAERFIDF